MEAIEMSAKQEYDGIVFEPGESEYRLFDRERPTQVCAKTMRLAKVVANFLKRSNPRFDPGWPMKRLSILEPYRNGFKGQRPLGPLLQRVLCLFLQAPL